MITRKAPELPSALPWPESFYSEGDPSIRLQLLEEHSSQTLDPEDLQMDEFRKKLFLRRYRKASKGKNPNMPEYTDLFMRAWLMMKLCSEEKINWLNRKRIEKEWHEYMRMLCLEDFSWNNETEHELLLQEWIAFFDQLIYSCVNDKTYRSTLLGLVPMKQEVLANKIAAELELVTEEFPQKLDVWHCFCDFHGCAEKAYKGSTAL